MYRFLAYGVGDDKVCHSAATLGTSASGRLTVEYDSDGTDSDDVDFSEAYGESFLNVAQPKHEPDMLEDSDVAAVQRENYSEPSTESRTEMVTSVSPAKSEVKKNSPGLGPDLSR